MLLSWFLLSGKYTLENWNLVWLWTRVRHVCLFRFDWIIEKKKMGVNFKVWLVTEALTEKQWLQKHNIQVKKKDVNLVEKARAAGAQAQSSFLPRDLARRLKAPHHCWESGTGAWILGELLSVCCARPAGHLKRSGNHHAQWNCFPPPLLYRKSLQTKRCSAPDNDGVFCELFTSSWECNFCMQFLAPCNVLMFKCNNLFTFILLLSYKSHYL